MNAVINEYYLGKYVGVHREVYAYFTYIHNVIVSVIVNLSNQERESQFVLYFYLLSSHTLFVGHSCAFIDAVFYARHLRVDAH